MSAPISREVRRHYTKLRQAGYRASHALSAARTLAEWRRLEDAGLVRLRAEYDEYDSIEEGEEVYGSVGEYRLQPSEYHPSFPESSDHYGEKWEHADSVWGHAGYRDVTDPLENWYVPDIMRQTIEALKDALRKRTYRSLPR